MADDSDARDDRVHGLLEVEPLDDLTRRRLVAAAMRASATETEPVRWSHRLVAAAVIVVVVFGAGLGYLASRDDGGTAPVADRESSTVASPAAGSAEAAGSPPASSTPSALGSKSEDRTLDDSTPPRDAGDFGDLRDSGTVDRIRAAFAGTSDVTAAAGGTSARVTTLLGELRSRPCTSELPEGRVLAVASGRYGTRRAIVVQTELADGTRSLDAVVTGPCEVRPLD